MLELANTFFFYENYNPVSQIPLNYLFSGIWEITNGHTTISSAGLCLYVQLAMITPQNGCHTKANLETKEFV